MKRKRLLKSLQVTTKLYIEKKQEWLEIKLRCTWDILNNQEWGKNKSSPDKTNCTTKVFRPSNPLSVYSCVHDWLKWTCWTPGHSLWIIKIPVTCTLYQYTMIMIHFSYLCWTLLNGVIINEFIKSTRWSQSMIIGLHLTDWQQQTNKIHSTSCSTH